MGCLLIAVGRALSHLQNVSDGAFIVVHCRLLWSPLFLLWITVLTWRSPQPFSSYFVKWFVCFYSLFVSISVVHRPAHVKDDRREAVNVDDSDVCAEFTAATDILWRALGRRVMHCSDPGPRTQRQAILLSFWHIDHANKMLNSIRFTFPLFLLPQKENQERRDKKVHRGDQEESALLERSV